MNDTVYSWVEERLGVGAVRCLCMGRTEKAIRRRSPFALGLHITTDWADVSVAMRRRRRVFWRRLDIAEPYSEDV